MKKIVLVSIIGVAVVIAVVVSLSKKNGSATESMGTAEIAEVAGHTATNLSGGTDPVPSMDDTASEDSELQTTDLVHSEENLSDEARMLLGLDGEEQNYNSMKAAIGKLPKDLSKDDVAGLQELLTRSNDQFPQGMRPIEINAVKNDVLDKLLRQDVLPEGIGLQLAEMASNPDNDPVWRDYSLQFMAPFYERVAEDASSQAAGELEVVREAMVAALDERGDTLAGTALIGLELLSRTYDEFDREATLLKALEIASDESASSASRLTAIRMASLTSTELGASMALAADTARSLAQTGETVLLRSAAIITLGEVGTDEDRELLESYTTADNQQIVYAARMALEKMDAR